MLNKLCDFIILKRSDLNDETISHEDYYQLSFPFGEHNLYLRPHGDRPFLYENNEYLIFLEGFFYESEYSCRKTIENLRVGDNQNLITDLKEFNGYYSGVLRDKKDNKLIFFSDKFGIRRIFYDCQLHIFSNSELDVAKYSALRVDMVALQETLILGYPLSNRTYLENVRVLLPLRIGLLEDHRFKEVFCGITVKEDGSTQKVKEAYEDFFEKLSFSKARIGLGLSKGKDSRMYLYFMNKAGIDYELFTFRENETDNEYRDCMKIAKSLDKQLLIVPDRIPSHEETIMKSLKDGRPISEFYRLGRFAKENKIDFLLLGYLGDHISGKISCFRTFGINSFDRLAHQLFWEYSEGVRKQNIEELCSKFTDGYHLVYDNWKKTFEDFKYLSLPKAEILHYLETRGLRRIAPLLLQVMDSVTMILPTTDNSVFYSYLALPEKSINSQQAHTKLASLDPSAAVAKSTAFPISLKNEKYFRTLIRSIVRYQNFRSKYKVVPDNHEILPLKSNLLRNIFSSKEIKATKILCKRLRFLDVYFRFLENNFSRKI